MSLRHDLDESVRGNAASNSGDQSPVITKHVDCAVKLLSLIQCGSAKDDTGEMNSLKKQLLAMPQMTGIKCPVCEDVSAEGTLLLKLLMEGIIHTKIFISLLEAVFGDPHIEEGRNDPPYSALRCLSELSKDSVESALTWISKDSGVPLLPLLQFQPQKEAVNVLPLEMTQHDRALAFDFLDEAVLVAILNPYDTDLLEQIRQLTGRECLFYLVNPRDFMRCKAALKLSSAQ